MTKSEKCRPSLAWPNSERGTMLLIRSLPLRLLRQGRKQVCFRGISRDGAVFGRRRCMHMHVLPSKEKHSDIRISPCRLPRGARIRSEVLNDCLNEDLVAARFQIIMPSLVMFSCCIRQGYFCFPSPFSFEISRVEATCGRWSRILPES
jgi:hypothetical protein